MLFNFFSGFGEGRAAQAARHRQGPLLLPPSWGEDQGRRRRLCAYRPVDAPFTAPACLTPVDAPYTTLSGWNYNYTTTL